MNQKETEAMKPTQQRTEEGELPALEVWQDDYGRLSAEMKSPYFRDFGPGRHEYVPASRLTALELELEGAKNALRELAKGNRSPGVLSIARAALRDLGEGQ